MIAVGLVVDTAANVIAAAVFSFAWSPPMHVKVSSWFAADASPTCIAMVSARSVVCEVVTLITATKEAPIHVQATLVASAVLQIPAEAVRVKTSCSFTAVKGVTLKMMFVGVKPALRLCGTADDIVHPSCVSIV
jgi:hypothetical protein